MGLGFLTDGMTGGRAKVRSRKTAFWKDKDKDRGRQLGRRISRESKRKRTTLTTSRDCILANATPKQPTG